MQHGKILRAAGMLLSLTALNAQATEAIAVGANVSNNGNYIVDTFLSNGSFDVLSGGLIDVMVVAGGGGGGARGDKGGGGGGAGGLIYETAYAVTPGLINVVVGEGGLGGQGSGSSATQGGNGQNSSFGDLVAIGGGGGGAGLPGSGNGSWNGLSGGSGGGASENAVPGSGVSGQGYDGGYQLDVASRAGGGGGAGGAGQPGQSDPNSAGGGIGLEINISGTPVWYAGGGAGGDNAYNAGVSLQGGGLGGGGGSAQDGSANTGGGGGGGILGNYSGGNGGSGVVIISFSSPAAVPVPAAVWLFGSALAGFIGFNLRKPKH